jgi:hypothetical protein
LVLTMLCCWVVVMCLYLEQLEQQITTNHQHTRIKSCCAMGPDKLHTHKTAGYHQHSRGLEAWLEAPPYSTNLGTQQLHFEGFGHMQQWQRYYS